MYKYKHMACTDNMHKAPNWGVMFKWLHYMAWLSIYYGARRRGRAARLQGWAGGKENATVEAV